MKPPHSSKISDGPCISNPILFEIVLFVISARVFYINFHLYHSVTCKQFQTCSPISLWHRFKGKCFTLISFPITRNCVTIENSSLTGAGFACHHSVFLIIRPTRLKKEEVFHQGLLKITELHLFVDSAFFSVAGAATKTKPELSPLEPAMSLNMTISPPDSIKSYHALKKGRLHFWM